MQVLRVELFCFVFLFLVFPSFFLNDIKNRKGRFFLFSFLCRLTIRHVFGQGGGGSTSFVYSLDVGVRRVPYRVYGGHVSVQSEEIGADEWNGPLKICTLRILVSFPFASAVGGLFWRYRVVRTVKELYAKNGVMSKGQEKNAGKVFFFV